MMDYEIFKQIIKEKFLDYMPDEYRNYKVDIYPATKINQTLDALCVFPADNELCQTPIIYLNDIYEIYKQSDNFEHAIRVLANDMLNALQNRSDITDIKDVLNLENTKDHIIMVLINTEQNNELLANVPHREFQDLSIIYRLMIENSKDAMAGTIINNFLAEMLEMDEAALFKAAYINTKKLFPPIIKSMSEIIHEMLINQGMPTEIADLMIQGTSPDMHIISNDSRINGATSILYEEELYKLAERLETNLFILPSSIHEVIAVTSDSSLPEELAQMVQEINMSEVTLDERLSNQVYHYDKDLRALSIAVQTDKRLDGMLAEKSKAR